MGFIKTILTGYKLMYQDLTIKHPDLLPRAFSGCGTGLMMIGSAVMAKTALKEDIQQIVAEANAVVDEAMKPVEGEKKATKVKRIFKAKVVKGWKMVKAFKKGVAMEIGGAVLNSVGYKMSENGKHTALKAAGSAMAAFAAYRANVRDDLGDEADIRYMSGRKAVKKTDKIDRKTGEVTHNLEYINDDDEIVLKKDPSSFKLLYSPETCPGVCSTNYHLRLNQIKAIQDNFSMQLQGVGHISLNDMRRVFGGLEPNKMDVDEGGIFGKVLDPNIPRHQQRINLHYEDDKDFMEGRKDWCYVIFDCDLILGKLKKIKQIEN